MQSVTQAAGSQGTQVLDIGHAVELNFDKGSNTRFCEADAALQTGTTRLSYKLYPGPSGKLLVEAKEGSDAFNAFGLSVGAYSQKQYDAKVEILRKAMAESGASHASPSTSQPDSTNVPAATAPSTPSDGEAAPQEAQPSDNQSNASQPPEEDPRR